MLTLVRFLIAGPWDLADTGFAERGNGKAIGSISTPGFYSLPNPRAGEPTHIINGGGGGAYYTAHFDAAKERLYNLSATSYHVGGSWGVARPAKASPCASRSVLAPTL